MKISFKILDLDWHEPFIIAYNREEDTYSLGSIPKDLLQKYGLYQIYGRHPVYGNDVLLYIGKTSGDSGTRSFQKRLNEHFRVGGRFYYHTNLSISLCPVQFNDEEVSAAESILISTHKPALNGQLLESPSKVTQKHLVRNWGFMQSLHQECSDCYFFE